MIRLIAAIDSRRGIAKAGVQPWKLPKDEQYFNQQTHKYGGVVLMGRKTFEVIGHPLKGRHNIIAANQKEGFTAPNCQITDDLNGFLNRATEDIWVIGGESIFKQTIGQAHELYLTIIDADFGCDQFFPDYSMFTLLHQSPPLDDNGLSFRYTVWTRPV